MGKYKSRIVASLLALAITIQPTISIAANKKEEDNNNQGSEKVIRLAGEDRIETSLKIAENLGVKDTIFYASADNIADALSSGTIATKSDAPIILTNKDNTSTKFKADNIVIVGGENSVTNLEEEKIKESNPKSVIKRISGENRYETSAELNKEYNIKNVGIVSGEKYVDALTATPYLNKIDNGILLRDNKNNKELPKDLSATVTIGGKNTIEKDYGKERISGKDRYETAINIAEKFGDYDTVILSSGTKYSDALSAGPLSKKYNAPILLTDGNNLSDEVKAIIKKVKKVIIIGGENTISKKVYNEVNILVGETKVDKSELKSLIEDCEECKSGDYTKETYYIFKKAVDEGKALLKKDCTQEEIDASIANIEKCKKDLEKITETEDDSDKPSETKVDKSELESLIKGFEEYKSENYTEETYYIFKKAIDEGKALLKKDCTQEEIDASIANIEKYRDELEKNKSDEETKSDFNKEIVSAKEKLNQNENFSKLGNLTLEGNNAQFEILDIDAKISNIAGTGAIELLSELIDKGEINSYKIEGANTEKNIFNNNNKEELKSQLLNDLLSALGAKDDITLGSIDNEKIISVVIGLKNGVEDTYSLKFINKKVEENEKIKSDFNKEIVSAKEKLNQNENFSKLGNLTLEGNNAKFEILDIDAKISNIAGTGAIELLSELVDKGEINSYKIGEFNTEKNIFNNNNKEELKSQLLKDLLSALGAKDDITLGSIDNEKVINVVIGLKNGVEDTYSLRFINKKVKENIEIEVEKIVNDIELKKN